MNFHDFDEFDPYENNCGNYNGQRLSSSHIIFKYKIITIS